VIDVLTLAHREIESMLRHLRSGTDQQGGEAALTRVLVAALVRHAVAEEEYVYPVVRSQVAGGERIADRGLAQHAQLEETMQQLADGSATDYWRLLGALETEVRRHIQYDETELFPKLRASCTRSDLARLGDQVAGLSNAHRDPPRSWHVATADGSLIDQVRAALAHRRGSVR
jgi:hemerythrin-like domain-containing protein